MSGMRARNLATTLRRRSRGDPMAQFDALPPDLRHWLARARLPWSPRSVRELWTRALAAEGGDAARALARLDRAEARALARDGRRLWGAGYPLGDEGEATRAGRDTPPPDPRPDPRRYA